MRGKKLFKPHPLLALLTVTATSSLLRMETPPGKNEFDSAGL